MIPTAPQQGFRENDFRIAVSLAVGIAAYYLLNYLVGDISPFVNICVLLICVAFLADVDWKTTWKAGVTRVVVTFIGAVAGLVPVLAYDLTGSETVLAVVFCALAVCAIVLVKRTGYAKIYVQCRIACVSYVLVVYTFHGAQYAAAGLTGYSFCLMWVLSTLLGVAVAVATAFAWDGVKKLAQRVKGR